MIEQRICLPCDWRVDIFYDARPQDAGRVLDRLWEMGCAERHLRKAERLLRRGRPNEGLTYSSHRERRSLIVVGRVTDFFELASTLSHEKQHLEQAICLADGLDPYGEDIAYISGETSAAIAHSAWRAVKNLFYGTTR